MYMHMCSPRGAGSRLSRRKIGQVVMLFSEAAASCSDQAMPGYARYAADRR